MGKTVVKTTLFVIFTTISSTTFAANDEDGDNLYVYTKGTTRAVTYSLDKLDKITFGETDISLYTSYAKTDYKYSNLSLLTFRDGIKPTTGIEKLTEEGSKIIISYNREKQVVTLYCEKALTSLQVLDLQGRLVARSNATKGNTVLTLSHLSQGIYIVKAVGTGIGKSVKIIK